MKKEMMYIGEKRRVSPCSRMESCEVRRCGCPGHIDGKCCCVSGPHGEYRISSAVEDVLIRINGTKPKFAYIGEKWRVTKCRYRDDHCKYILGCPGEIDRCCPISCGGGASQDGDIDNAFIHLFVNRDYPILYLGPVG